MPEINPKAAINSVNIHGNHNLYFWDTNAYGCFSLRVTNNANLGGNMGIKFGDVTFDNTHNHNVTIDKFGNNQSHNNIAPYISAYIWKRIS